MQPTLQTQQLKDAQTNRAVILVKVKRKAPDQINPQFLQLHRIIEGFDLYPEDVADAQAYQQRRKNDRNEQRNGPNDNELVSLFGNVSLVPPSGQEESLSSPLTTTNFQSQTQTPTQSRLHHYPSGYVESQPQQSQHSLTHNEHHDLLGKSDSITTTQQSRYNIKSRTLFKKVGMATQHQLSSSQLNDWYQNNIGNNNNSNENNNSHNNNHNNHQSNTNDENNTNCLAKSPHQKQNIAMFEVTTLEVAEQRLQGCSVLNESQKNEEKNSQDILSRLKQMYGDTVQQLAKIQPIEDHNYVPKQKQQYSSSSASTRGQTATSASITALKVDNQPIKGLRPPPPRRNNNAKHTHSTNNLSTSPNVMKMTPTARLSLLDQDTLDYINQRKALEQQQNNDDFVPVNGNGLNNSTNNNNTHSNNTNNNDIHNNNTNNNDTTNNTNNNLSSQDNTNHDDDVYDIYEVSINTNIDGLATIDNNNNDINNTTTSTNNNNDSAVLVIPSSELDYVIAIDQVDGAFEHQSVHDEFVSQFSKPRLHFHQRLLHHIHQSQTRSRLTGKKRFIHDGMNGATFEEIEQGFYDDDYHPDFDSDMDYPDHSGSGSDSDDDGDDNNNNSNADDSDNNSSDDDNDDGAANGLYRDNDDDEHERYYNHYDDEDDFDDDDVGSIYGNNGTRAGFFDNNSEDDDNLNGDSHFDFRYAGVQSKSLHDLDTQDPITREFVLNQYHKSFKKQSRELNTTQYRLNGQDCTALPAKMSDESMNSNTINNNTTTTTNNNNNENNDNNEKNSMNNHDQVQTEEKLNREMYALLFEDDCYDNDDDDDINYHRKHNRHGTGNHDDDEEDPYGGSNTFYQYSRRQ